MELTVFENEKFGEIRSTIINGEPWFVLADICKVLELKNPSVSASSLQPDERSKMILGRQGEANIINESGLYTLIISSRKKKAIAFRKWVTSEVLPSIRKTGSYSINESAINATPANLELEKYKAETDRINAESQKKLADISVLKETVQMLRESIPDAEGEYKESLGAKLFELLNGGPLEKEEKERPLYKANKIGKMIGISGNMVGRIANKNNLKRSSFGKQIPYLQDGKIHYNFCYYESVVPKIKKCLKENK